MVTGVDGIPERLDREYESAEGGRLSVYGPSRGRLLVTNPAGILRTGGIA